MLPCCQSNFIYSYYFFFHSIFIPIRTTAEEPSNSRNEMHNNKCETVEVIIISHYTLGSKLNSNYNKNVIYGYYAPLTARRSLSRSSILAQSHKTSTARRSRRHKYATLLTGCTNFHFSYGLPTRRQRNNDE